MPMKTFSVYTNGEYMIQEMPSRLEYIFEVYTNYKGFPKEEGSDDKFTAMCWIENDLCDILNEDLNVKFPLTYPLDDDLFYHVCDLWKLMTNKKKQKMIDKTKSRLVT